MTCLRCAAVVCVLVGVLGSTESTDAAIIISEIMYNPDSSEAAPVDTEWVEIYNTGGSSVDIGGWRLQDEDGGGTGGLPVGTMIDAFQAIVLISDDQTVADFQAAWGTGFDIYALSSWIGTGNLGNTPSATDEILTLRDDLDAIVDTVNYDDTSGWPTDSPDGPSIYLLPDSLDTLSNDVGSSWARSTVGVHGAYQNTATADFNGIDIGSPGYVASNVPEPAALVLWSLGLVGVAAIAGRRRRLV